MCEKWWKKRDWKYFIAFRYILRMDSPIHSIGGFLYEGISNHFYACELSITVLFPKDQDSKTKPNSCFQNLVVAEKILLYFDEVF